MVRYVSTRNGAPPPSEPLWLLPLFSTIRSFNIMHYLYTRNGAGKVFLLDLLKGETSALS